MSSNPVSSFLEKHYRHFNAAVLVDAAKAYKEHIDRDRKMMITLAGAMSTAEIGISLAEMIRQDKVHIISCTGANLEEDLFNLVAHDHYKRIPDYRNLTPDQEYELFQNSFNRVTDTCIPEEEAFRRVEKSIIKLWEKNSSSNTQLFPHEYIYEMLRSGDLRSDYQIDPANSWLVAACEKDLPLIVPGWEDSTLGNVFAARAMEKKIKTNSVKSGIEYMQWLAEWYRQNAGTDGVGFFQIGGGIAGDFPICVVPMLHQDLKMDDIPEWSYFCQISDSTTSYGSYSGAVPSEKITWGKLGVETPKFVIESDATIVAPLIFAYVLEW